MTVLNHREEQPNYRRPAPTSHRSESEHLTANYGRIAKDQILEDLNESFEEQLRLQRRLQERLSRRRAVR